MVVPAIHSMSSRSSVTMAIVSKESTNREEGASALGNIKVPTEEDWSQDDSSETTPTGQETNNLVSKDPIGDKTTHRRIMNLKCFV